MFKQIVILLSIFSVALAALNSEPFTEQSLRAAASKPKAPLPLQFSYNKLEFDNYVVTPLAVGAVTAGGSASEEVYNAPLYKTLDATGAPFGVVALVDNLSTRAGSLYVTEMGTYFADAVTGLGSAITYEFSYLSSTGSGVWPAGTVIKTKSTSSSGIFADKNYDISISVLASGVRQVTATVIK